MQITALHVASQPVGIKCTCRAIEWVCGRRILSGRGPCTYLFGSRFPYPGQLSSKPRQGPRPRAVTPQPPPPGPLEAIVSSRWTIPIALGVLHLVVALAAFHPSPFSGGDDATYIALARSILERHTYSDIWDPGLAAQTLYPPVFPAIVAGGLLLGLNVAIGLKLMMVFISSAAVFLSCLWLWRVATPGIALGAGILVALSPEVIGLGREVLSDTPFWLFTMIALLALWKVERAIEGPDRDSGNSLRWEILAALAVVAAYFTRSAGLPLLLASLIWLVLRKQWRPVLILAGTSAPFILAWWLRGTAHPGNGYLAPFLYIDPYVPARGNVNAHDLLERLQQNLFKYRLNHLPRIVTGLGYKKILPGTLLALFAAFGWIRRMGKPGVADLWTFFYLGLVLFWPVAWGAPRFLLAIIPVLALYVAETVGFFAEISTRPRIVGTIATGLLIGIMAPGVMHHLSDGSICREQYAEGEQFPCTEPLFHDFFLTAAGARGKLPPGSVVLSRKPTLFYLYSGYQSRLYPLSQKPDTLFEEAAIIGAKFVVIDQLQDLAPLYLHPVLLANRDDFCVIPELSHRNAVLARIERGGPASLPGTAPNVFRVCPQNALAAKTE